MVVPSPSTGIFRGSSKVLISSRRAGSSLLHHVNLPISQTSQHALTGISLKSYTLRGSEGTWRVIHAQTNNSPHDLGADAWRGVLTQPATPSPLQPPGSSSTSSCGCATQWKQAQTRYIKTKLEAQYLNMFKK